jgi:hypothetical protein
VATCCPGLSAHSLSRASWQQRRRSASNAAAVAAMRKWARRASNGGPGTVKRGGSRGELIRRPASRGGRESRWRNGKPEQGRRRGGDFEQNSHTGCSCRRTGRWFRLAWIQPVNQKKVFGILINIFLVNTKRKLNQNK